MTELTVEHVVAALADQIAYLLPNVTIYANPNQQGTQLPAVFITPMTSKIERKIGRAQRTLAFDLVYLEAMDLPDLTERYLRAAEALDGGMALVPYQGTAALRIGERKWFTELDSLHYQIKIKAHAVCAVQQNRMQALERLTEEVT